MTKNFSTDDVHPRDRFAYWYDFVCDGLIHADCTMRGDQPFFGKVRFASAATLRIAELTCTLQSVARSPRVIARDPTDSLAVTFQHVDGNVLTQDGCDLMLRADEIVLSDMTRPWQIKAYNGLAHTVMLLPRSELLSRLGAVEPYVGKKIDGRSGVGGMLTPLLHALPAHLDLIPAAVQERLGQNILDLVATALLSQVEDRPLSARMTLVRVKLWIEAHLGEPLSADGIASACWLSVRYLNRLFEREGSSLMHHVWERRLARCRRDIRDPAMRRRQIGDIAFAAGFNDLSHFSRAYHARYGCSPRDDRGQLSPRSVDASNSSFDAIRTPTPSGAGENAV